MPEASASSLPPDYHMHTVLCKHARGVPREYRLAAAERRLPAICITDHAAAPDGYDPENRMLPGEYTRYCELVAEARNGAATAPEVLFGIEADYYPAGLDHLRRWLPRQPFDLVLGSVHCVDDWCIDCPNQIKRWQSADVPAAWRAYFALLTRMAATRLFDVVAHLDLPKKFGFRPSDRDVAAMAAPALDAIQSAGMAVEINTAGLRKPVGEIYPAPLLLAMMRERGIPICFGSDAHAPEEVGHAFPQALRLAREAGYTTAVRFRQRRMTSHPLPDPSTVKERHAAH